MRRGHGFILLLCLGLCACVLWVLNSLSPPALSPAPVYEETFRQSVSQALQRESERRHELPEEQRRATFNQQQEVIITSQIERQAAADIAYEQARERAWQAYYEPPSECVAPAQSAAAAACVVAVEKARKAFELFYDPDVIQVE